MPAGSRHVVRAAVAVLIVALAVPAAALAAGGGTCKASACKVYHEQNVPSSGRQKPPPQKPTGSKSGGGQQPPVLKSRARVLAQAGADRGPLKKLLNQDPGIGSLSSGSAGGSPSLFGAAFDLGAGPTILLAILLGVGIGLAARSRVGGWLGKRSS